jgi:hypothetical protein
LMDCGMWLPAFQTAKLSALSRTHSMTEGAGEKHYG